MSELSGRADALTSGQRAWVIRYVRGNHPALLRRAIQALDQLDPLARAAIDQADENEQHRRAGSSRSTARRM
jgi:hypothetical protein